MSAPMAAVTETHLSGVPPRRAAERSASSTTSETRSCSSRATASPRSTACSPPAIPDKGRDPHATLELLVPEVLRRREPSPRNRGRAIPRSPPGRPLDARRPLGPRAESRRDSLRVRRARIPRRLGLGGIQEDGEGLRHPASRRSLRGGPAARADLHARHEERVGSRRERLLRRLAAAVGAESGGAPPRSDAGSLPARRRAIAASRGLLLADTKLEFGRLDGRLIWIDEAFTPDSSRYWDAAAYKPGRSPALLRQAIRARLARVDRLGQAAARAPPSRGDRPHHPREIPRSVPHPDGPASGRCSGVLALLSSPPVSPPSARTDTQIESSQQFPISASGARHIGTRLGSPSGGAPFFVSR